MKIILFRFEKENINFIECIIDSKRLMIGTKEKISLLSSESKGERYNKVLDELLQIKVKHSPDLFAYQSPQKYMGAIKDEDGFANSAILHLFCYKNDIELLELTPPSVRSKLAITKKEFKDVLAEEEISVIETYGISKSDKIFNGLVFLSLLKNIL